MITVEEFNKRLDKLMRIFESGALAEYIATKKGIEIENMVRNRVIMKQINEKGSKFSPYSKRSILSSGTTEKSSTVFRTLANSKTKRRKLKWVTIKKGGKTIRLFEVPGGYDEIRKIEGFPNKNKSYEFTGKMWQQFGLVKKKSSKTQTIVSFGGQTKYAQDLINHHSEREGLSIIGMTKTEERVTAKWVDDWLKQQVKIAGL